MKLTVYGWQGHRQMPQDRYRNQTREIVAVPSKAALYRLLPDSRKSDFFNLTETANREEVELAMNAPNVVLWRPLDYPGRGGWNNDPRTPMTLRAMDEGDGCGR